MSAVVRSVLKICLGMTVMFEVASAHEGHGDPASSTGLIHYLTSPLHLTELVCAAAAILTLVVVARLRFRRRSRVPAKRRR